MRHARVARTAATHSPWRFPLAVAFVCVSVALLGLVMVRHANGMRRAGERRVKARAAVDVYTLSRTANLSAGDFHYAVLGLGQDTSSGRQVVWVRSYSSGRVGGFAEGERIFGGPVRVRGIERDRVTIALAGRTYGADLTP